MGVENKEKLPPFKEEPLFEIKISPILPPLLARLMRAWEELVKNHFSFSGRVVVDLNNLTVEDDGGIRLATYTQLKLGKKDFPRSSQAEIRTIISHRLPGEFLPNGDFPEGIFSNYPTKLLLRNLLRKLLRGLVNNGFNIVIEGNTFYIIYHPILNSNIITTLNIGGNNDIYFVLSTRFFGQRDNGQRKIEELLQKHRNVVHAIIYCWSAIQGTPLPSISCTWHADEELVERAIKIINVKTSEAKRKYGTAGLN